MKETKSKYKIAQAFKYEGDDWWSWAVWIEASEEDLNEIEEVVYTLHPTFNNPVRKNRDRDSKFKLETEGWGVFPIYGKIQLIDGSKVNIKHDLYLAYPDGTANMA